MGEHETGSGAGGGWRAALRDRGFRWEAAATLLGLAVGLYLLSRFLEWVEERPGVVLADPVLAWLAPRDFSTPTFSLIYGGIAASLASQALRPRRLVQVLQAYLLVVALRVLMMWVTPLEISPAAVPLRDPLIENFGPAQVLTRDLFFSGHTSTLMLAALACPLAWLRRALYLATAMVAALLVAQHAHYTVDVLVAPFVAYGSWTAVRRLHGAR